MHFSFDIVAGERNSDLWDRYLAAHPSYTPEEAALQLFYSGLSAWLWYDDRDLMEEIETLSRKNKRMREEIETVSGERDALMHQILTLRITKQQEVKMKDDFDCHQAIKKIQKKYEKLEAGVMAENERLNKENEELTKEIRELRGK